MTSPTSYGGLTDGWYVFRFCPDLLDAVEISQEKFKVYNWFMTSWLLVLFLVAGRFNNSPWYYYP